MQNVSTSKPEKLLNWNNWTNACILQIRCVNNLYWRSLVCLFVVLPPPNQKKFHEIDFSFLFIQCITNVRWNFVRKVYCCWCANWALLLSTWDNSVSYTGNFSTLPMNLSRSVISQWNIVESYFDLLKISEILNPITFYLTKKVNYLLKLVWISIIWNGICSAIVTLWTIHIDYGWKLATHSYVDDI